MLEPQIDAPQLMMEMDFGPLPLKISERWVDESGTQSIHRNQRTTGATPARERLAQHSAGERSRGLRRVRIQRREQYGMEHTIICRSLAGDDIRNGPIWTPPQQFRQRQIIARPCTGGAT